MLLNSKVDYKAPEWMPSSDILMTPPHKITLAHTPTPFQKVHLPGLPESCPHIFFKRDDMTGGIELGGNKTRKLEFILAEAKDQGCDCIVTAGGTQSNHCRATTAAARTVGLDCYLVLRDDFHDEGGNYFLNQLLGANIRVMNREEYMEKGGFTYFLEEAADRARAAGKKPYIIPVGGSSPVGCWGYVECMKEITNQIEILEPQLGGAPFSDVVVTTGSGGTLCGLGLAAKYYNASKKHSSGMPINVHAYGVCDTPDFFYGMVDDLVGEMFFQKKKKEGEEASSASKETTTETNKNLPDSCRNWLDIRSARGLGYSKASTEELQFLNAVSRETGVLLDRAYTNKCVFQMVKDIQSGSLKPKGKLLFVHTGGGPSVFDQHEKILKMEGFEATPMSPQMNVKPSEVTGAKF